MANINPPQDFFWLNRRLLRDGGLLEPPNLSFFPAFLYKVYKFYVIIYVYIWYVGSEFASIVDTYEDLYAASNSLNMSLTHFASIGKCIMFLLKADEFLEILDTLGNAELKYEGTLDFDPFAIVNYYRKQGVIYTMGFYILGAATIMSAFLPPVIQTIMIMAKGENFLNSTVYGKTPYSVKMPFTFETPVSYLCMLFYQAIPYYTFEYTIVGMDCLFMNIMNSVACHMAILQGAFTTIKQRCMKRLQIDENDVDVRRKELNDEMFVEFKTMIQHIQEVRRCATKLENIHCYLTMSQILACCFVICSSLLLISTTPLGSKEFNTFVVYLLAISFQLGIYCSFGNNVTIQSSKVPVAIWNSDWIDTSITYKKMMVFTIQSMQKPIIFTIGKFAPLTLSSYMSILKLSYSYFAVLRKKGAK